MYQLDWIMGFPDIWLNIVSEYFCEGVSDEISIWISKLSRGVCPPQCGWESSSWLRAWIEQKAEEGKICSFCLIAWAGTLAFSCPWTGTYTTVLFDSQASDLNYSSGLQCRLCKQSSCHLGRKFQVLCIQSIAKHEFFCFLLFMGGNRRRIF